MAFLVWRMMEVAKVHVTSLGVVFIGAPLYPIAIGLCITSRNAQ